MSTRSMVGIKQPDGTIKAMWKHWDGYPSYMTPFLDNYNDDDLAEELVRFDKVDSFMTQEEKDRNQKDYPDSYPEELFYKLSTGDYLFGGIGEPQFYTKDELFGDTWAEYAYVWNDYRWIVIDPRADDL